MKSFLYTCLVSSSFAGFTPGNPYGESVWPVGTTQTITWEWKDAADDTAAYKDIDKLVIDFMTGSDENNELISNIATVKPSETQLKFKIPNVPKNGKIYFIRLTGFDKSGKDVQYNWSTRFTITGSSGKHTSEATTSTATSDKSKSTNTSTDIETSTETGTTTTVTKTTTATTKTSYVPTPDSSSSTLAISVFGLLSAALVAFL